MVRRNTRGLDYLSALLPDAPAGRLRIRTSAWITVWIAQAGDDSSGIDSRMCCRDDDPSDRLAIADYARLLVETGRPRITSSAYSESTRSQRGVALLRPVRHWAVAAGMVRQSPSGRPALSIVFALQPGFAAGAHQLSVRGRACSHAANTGAGLVRALSAVCARDDGLRSEPVELARARRGLRNLGRRFS